jgi:hypothetical protein
MCISREDLSKCVNETVDGKNEGSEPTKGHPVGQPVHYVTVLSDIRKSNKLLTLRSNGGSMQVGHVASIDKTTEVWFSNKVIFNIILLQDVKRHYHMTYDSYNVVFIVWREEQGLPNMVFKEHSSGLHFYDL